MTELPPLYLHLLEKWIDSHQHELMPDRNQRLHLLLDHFHDPRRPLSGSSSRDFDETLSSLSTSFDDSEES